jgi:hypothetical protein
MMNNCLPAGEPIVEAGGFHFKALGEVPLGITVYQEDSHAQLREGDPDFPGEGGFAHPAFLVGEDDPTHSSPPSSFFQIRDCI